jgi:hypothetical protein
MTVPGAGVLVEAVEPAPQAEEFDRVEDPTGGPPPLGADLHDDVGAKLGQDQGEEEGLLEAERLVLAEVARVTLDVVEGAIVAEPGGDLVGPEAEEPGGVGDEGFVIDAVGDGRDVARPRGRGRRRRRFAAFQERAVVALDDDGPGVVLLEPTAAGQAHPLP